jgi:hypothetical protein
VYVYFFFFDGSVVVVVVEVVDVDVPVVPESAFWASCSSRFIAFTLDWYPPRFPALSALWAAV